MSLGAKAMILSMLFVYPKEQAGTVADQTVVGQKHKILSYWHEHQCPEEDVTNCVGVGEAEYKELAQVGLTSKSTRAILDAVASSIGPAELQRHVMATSLLGQKLGLGGFKFRVTELNHPDGFPYLAVGFVVE
jgi:hypothetical protein